MANLAEGMLRELARNRDLLTEYVKIGPAGAFGALMIRQRIAEGEAAIASGDVVRMIAAYKELESTE